MERMDHLPRIAWITSLGTRGRRRRPPSERVDSLPLSTWMERVEDLSRSAWIASLGARGRPPSERVDRFLWRPPKERMDNLPRSAWISVWIASLGARGSPSLSAWMVALGARGSPPFERMDGLPRSLGACGCALGHTDGLSLDHRQAARSCGPTCARCCGHMHHRRAQSARATARRRNAKGRNDQRVCIFVPELCCRGFSWRGFKNPNYFRPPII
jgi:hypothetical protein